MVTFKEFKQRYPELCQQATRVVVMDDSVQGRAGMSALMHQPPTLEVVGSASTPAELFVLCERHRPTVIILDLCLPLPADGLAACRAVRERCPTLPVLMVTGHDQERTVEPVKAAGAKGFAIKNFSDGLLWKCVLEVAAGGEAFHPLRTHWLPEEFSEAQRLAHLARCKPNEVWLLAALARRTQRADFRVHGAVKDLLNAEAQSELLRDLKHAAAEQLVRDILETLRKKLGFHSSVEAARWYAKLLPTPATGPMPGAGPDGRRSRL